MAGHFDSEHVFSSRLKAFGIKEADIETLSRKNIKTMAHLAYITHIQPGAGDDTPFFESLAAALGLGSVEDIPLSDKTAYRRAWFEAATVAVAEIKAKIERTDDVPRHMPQQERIARGKQQQLRLQGVRIEAGLEPSHALLDLVWSMREEDQLKFISPELCTSRSQEALGIKRETFMKSDASGTLKKVERDEVFYADMSTEYRIKLALTRRALAFDQCGIVPYSSIEALHDEFYALVMREPLETHHPITVAQILRADKILWLKMIDLTKEGILSPIAGVLPVEHFLPVAKLDPVYVSMLAPLPKPASGPIMDIQVKSFSSNSAPYARSDSNSGKGGSHSGN